MNLKEILKGKCRTDFDRFVGYKYIIDGKLKSLKLFYSLPLAAQFGVVQDFGDDTGIYIDVKFDIKPTRKGGYLDCYDSFIMGEVHGVWNSRDSARLEAAKQFVENYNKR